VTVVAAIFSKKVALMGPAAALGPYLVGVLVWAIGLSLGGTTGCAINPARDLGPRIAHSLLPLGKKADSGWNYAVVPDCGSVPWSCLGGDLRSSRARLVILDADISKHPIRRRSLARKYWIQKRLTYVHL
jgi:hypothetical protein